MSKIVSDGASPNEPWAARAWANYTTAVNASSKPFTYWLDLPPAHHPTRKDSPPVTALRKDFTFTYTGSQIADGLLARCDFLSDQFATLEQLLPAASLEFDHFDARPFLDALNFALEATNAFRAKLAGEAGVYSEHPAQEFVLSMEDVRYFGLMDEE